MPIPLPLLHTLRSAEQKKKKAATGRDERREVFRSKTRILSSNARENSCAARASLRRDHADAQRIPSRFLRLVPRNDAGDIDGDAANENENENENDAARGGSKGAALCFFFVSLRAAHRASSVGHVVDEDTHKFGFPQISRDREDCETTDTLGARADAARDFLRKKFCFFLSGFALPRQKALEKKTRTETTSSSPVMKLQKGVSQKHHSQCPNFRVLLPDSSGCPVEN